ncbi:MAG: DUF6644 family protein [Pseudohongiellaceae bacterium]
MNEIFASYKRTIIVSAVLLLILVLELLNWRTAVYGGLFPLFEWLQRSTWLGYVATNYGSIYALVQAIHLLSMALLGGTILLMDLRLLNLSLKTMPVDVVVENAYRWFRFGLMGAVVSGIFLAAGVAEKVYYLPVFWAKMLALLGGSLFVIFFKIPLLRKAGTNSVWLIRVVAITSLMVWFTVAATGRWIGFVG